MRNRGVGAMRRRSGLVLWWSAAVVAVVTGPSVGASGFPGTQSDWNGFRRFDFELDQVACRVVVPQRPARGRPWIWRARFWGHQPQTEVALLERGFHVAYCDVADLWGNTEALRRWSRLYEFLTSQHSLSRRPALLGMSRGGLMIYAWALAHPDRVSCIYGDAPALGIRPYVTGLEEGDPQLAQLRGWMQAHRLTLPQAQAYRLDALDRGAVLAAAGIPIIHVCGDADESVPFAAHTAEFARRYRQLGGEIEVIVKRGGKHHPHSLPDPTPLVSFIVEQQSRVASGISHGPLLGHLTPTTALVWARCTVPGRYQLSARSSGPGAAVRVDAQAERAHDGCLRWHLEGLRPHTRYTYQVAFEGRPMLGGAEFFFDTPAVAQKQVRLAFASCAREDAGSAAVWRRMQGTDPQGVVLLGDTPYIDSTDLAEQRRRYGAFLGVDSLRRLLRNRSFYATWDDHDFGRNDTDGNLPGKQNSRRAFVEYHANPSYGEGQNGVYTRFRRAGVEVFLLDTRFFAATEPSPFAPDRPSLLGASQWRWLLRALKESTAPFKVLACGMIWNGAVRPGKRDHWGTYPHEREALFEFVGREAITGLMLVGGDVHRTRVLRHHSEATAGYRILELVTSPVHDGVIATAKAPHPALLHDFGQPHSFLLLEVDSRARPATCRVAFMGPDGKPFFEMRVAEWDLSKAGRR